VPDEPTVSEDELTRVPDRRAPGRSLVTSRALIDIVRPAVLGCYGVTGFASGPRSRLTTQLGFGQPGPLIRRNEDGSLDVDIDMTVALGVPVAEVARQVDSAVRYALQRALERPTGRIVIHVDGLRVNQGTLMPGADPSEPTLIRPHELADSGSDVA
jgi:uncharacterized alkaline shock family protein YloU